MILLLGFLFFPSPASGEGFQPFYVIETDRHLIEADAFYVGAETVLFLRRSSRSGRFEQIPRSRVVSIFSTRRERERGVEERSHRPEFHFIEPEDYSREFVDRSARDFRGKRTNPKILARFEEAHSHQLRERIAKLEKDLRSARTSEDRSRLDLSTALDEIVSLKMRLGSK